MPDAVANLLGEKIKQGSRGLSHGIFQIYRIYFVPVEISREKDLSEAVEDVNDAFLGGNRLVINVCIALRVVAAFNNAFGNRRQTCFDRAQILKIYFTLILFFFFHCWLTSLFIEFINSFNGIHENKKFDIKHEVVMNDMANNRSYYMRLWLSKKQTIGRVII